jgi:hypothetical protein
MDAGKHGHVGVGRDRLAGEREAVADNVRDGVENLGRLIVVRQDHRIARPFQREDRFDVARDQRLLGREQMPAYALIEVREWRRRQSGWGGRAVHSDLIYSE